MDDVDRAVEVLRHGGLVAFPTETVYGLGADATQAAAVQRIFAAKGRPSTNPIIVHVADEDLARRYSAQWPESATRLAARFWPGPITLVLPKQPSIVPDVTAGLNTVGLRCPNHPLALEMLRRFAGAVAAPSANRSTRVSPTTAQHVREELGDAVDCLLDGGPCPVGIESTVLDLTADPPAILRPGHITAQQIEEEIGPVATVQGPVHPGTAAVSPGQQALHYAPIATAYRFEALQLPHVLHWCLRHARESWAVLVIRPLANAAAAAELSDLIADQELPLHKLIEMPSSAREYGHRLYAILRDLDGRRISTIWIQMPPDQPQWTAIRDRITRATRDFE